MFGYDPRSTFQIAATTSVLPIGLLTILLLAPHYYDYAYGTIFWTSVSSIFFSTDFIVGEVVSFWDGVVVFCTGLMIGGVILFHILASVSGISKELDGHSPQVSVLARSATLLDTVNLAFNVSLNYFVTRQAINSQREISGSKIPAGHSRLKWKCVSHFVLDRVCVLRAHKYRSAASESRGISSQLHLIFGN